MMEKNTETTSGLSPEAEKSLRQQYAELTFTDDFMFWKVLTTDLDLCRELLELILGVRIARIIYAQPQDAVELAEDARGIRLDVYVEGEEEVYNLEMQAAANGNLAKRTRYYQGMIDLRLIERGADFSELKKSYIIFICTFDPFGKGLPLYTFENRCVEDGTVWLKDESGKVFVNGMARDIPDKLGEFIGYLNGNISGKFSKKLDEAVKRARENKEWRAAYMTLRMRDMENQRIGLKQGIEQGLKQGIEQGIKQGVERVALRLLQQNRPIEDIMDGTGLSRERIQQLREEEQCMS